MWVKHYRDILIMHVVGKVYRQNFLIFTLNTRIQNHTMKMIRRRFRKEQTKKILFHLMHNESLKIRTTRCGDGHWLWWLSKNFEQILGRKVYQWLQVTRLNGNSMFRGSTSLLEEYQILESNSRRRQLPLCLVCELPWIMWWVIFMKVCSCKNAVKFLMGDLHLIIAGFIIFWASHRAPF